MMNVFQLLAIAPMIVIGGLVSHYGFPLPDEVKSVNRQMFILFTIILLVGEFIRFWERRK